MTGREKSRFLTPFAEAANGFGMTGGGEAARGVEEAGPSRPMRRGAFERTEGRERQVPHAVRGRRERVRSRECIRDAKGANDTRLREAEAFCLSFAVGCHPEPGTALP